MNKHEQEFYDDVIRGLKEINEILKNPLDPVSLSEIRDGNR